jgi:hypothetical protein
MQDLQLGKLNILLPAQEIKGVSLDEGCLNMKDSLPTQYPIYQFFVRQGDRYEFDTCFFFL